MFDFLTNLSDVPWAWYITRSSGFVAYSLLYVSFLFGFAIRIPFFRQLFSFVNPFKAHCFISIQALTFATIHMGALLFDHFPYFNVVQILVPFASDYKPNLVALGVLAFYAMIVLTLSSYWRTKISNSTWRILHFNNMLIYIFVFIHALFLGTDMKTPGIAITFIIANIVLVLIIFYFIIAKVTKRKA